MTPQEQIAYLRSRPGWVTNDSFEAITAVCDLAERALLLEEVMRRHLGDAQFDALLGE